MAKNDPPTTLRMGFGYEQARAAGLGGVRSDRSPAQVNRIIKERKSEREALEYIRAVIKRDPEWEAFVAHWVKEGLSAVEIDGALFCAQAYMRAKKQGPKRLAYHNKFLPPF